MTAQLAYVGLVMFAAGLGSYYATKEFAAFNVVNVAGGALLLAAAAASTLRRLRHVSGPYSRPLVLRGLLLIVAALALGAAGERALDWADIRFDWTFERRFEIAPATRRACRELGPITATLYYDEADPRTRRSRLLLETLARECEMEVAARPLDYESDEVDRYAIGSSNTVVIERGERFETVGRPTEGAIYEALYRLRSLDGGTLAVLRGEGEGDPERTDDVGFSGLAAALANEGYQLRSVVTAAMNELPEDTAAVLVLAPRRRIRAAGLDVLRRYLADGGRMVALLEPGRETGIEEILAEWGMTTPDAVLIDPASGEVEQSVRGINPVAYNYSVHPVTKGLNRNRMTFFAGARSFALRKPRVEDQLEGVVLSSPRAWLSEDLSWLSKRRGEPSPDGARQGYHPLVAIGIYPREGGETRIVAIGDSDFATNRYLRAVYNLDLVLNAVHWAVQREAEITTRPKAGPPLHFPLPIADSLQTLYGVGVLVPEVLLIVGGIVWLRRRSA